MAFSPDNKWPRQLRMNGTPVPFVTESWSLWQQVMSKNKVLLFQSYFTESQAGLFRLLTESDYIFYFTMFIDEFFSFKVLSWLIRREFGRHFSLCPLSPLQAEGEISSVILQLGLAASEYEQRKQTLEIPKLEVWPNRLWHKYMYR